MAQSKTPKILAHNAWQVAVDNYGLLFLNLTHILSAYVEESFDLIVYW